MLLDDLGLMEERDERLVGRRNEHELQRVAIERDALECGYDRTKNGTTSDWSKGQRRFSTG